MSESLTTYVERLFEATSFENAFSALEDEALRMGFDGVLYTYIPQPLIDSDFFVEPVYQVSREYAPDYLRHYAEARFDRSDPLIKAVADGVRIPVDWWGEICKRYMDEDAKSREVIDTSRDYGIRNGVTLPLTCGKHGISGASFISEQGPAFELLMREKLADLTLRTNLFHQLVVANSGYMSSFVKPLLGSLSETEMRCMAGLAAGYSLPEIAAILHRTDKYLEQVIMRMRRKLSGDMEDNTNVINRNQLMYYAGLINLLEFVDSQSLKLK